MKTQRKASAEWHGGLKDGKGAITTGSGVLQATQYSFATRFENGKGTNPEELVAAAHAGCFAMALSMILGLDGLTADTIRAEATVTLEKVGEGFEVTSSHLVGTSQDSGRGFGQIRQGGAGRQVRLPDFQVAEGRNHDGRGVRGLRRGLTCWGHIPKRTESHFRTVRHGRSCSGWLNGSLPLPLAIPLLPGLLQPVVEAVKRAIDRSDVVLERSS